MYKVKETIIVEGVYDKIKLSRFIDAPILTTGGFSVYRSAEMLETIKKLAAETGIIILTDSDSAGFRIRSYIKQSISEGRVLNAYIPDIRGKEKRKREAGREGLLGVEGVSEELILEALKRAGASIDGSAGAPKRARAITKADMMKLGLAGTGASRERRGRLCAALGLPMKLSANMLLDVLNRLVDNEELEKLCSEL